MSAVWITRDNYPMNKINFYLKIYLTVPNYVIVYNTIKNKWDQSL